MIFCYTLTYKELILMITLSSLMLVICVFSFFLDYSSGVYQFHKCFQEQVFTYINFLEYVSHLISLIFFLQYLLFFLIILDLIYLIFQASQGARVYP